MEAESHSICPFVSGLFCVFHYLFYFWLRWPLVAVLRLSLGVMSGGYSSSWCSGFSVWRLLLFQSSGSIQVGLVVVAHGLSCSGAWGIFPEEG